MANYKFLFKKSIIKSKVSLKPKIKMPAIKTDCKRENSHKCFRVKPQAQGLDGRVLSRKLLRREHLYYFLFLEDSRYIPGPVDRIKEIMVSLKHCLSPPIRKQN